MTQQSYDARKAEVHERGSAMVRSGGWLLLVGIILFLIVIPVQNPDIYIVVDVCSLLIMMFAVQRMRVGRMYWSFE